MKKHVHIRSLFGLTLLALFFQAAGLGGVPAQVRLQESTEQISFQTDPPGSEFASGFTCLPDMVLPTYRPRVPAFSVFDVLPVPWKFSTPDQKLDRLAFSGLSPPALTF
jgi:hypothetical protein